MAYGQTISGVGGMQQQQQQQPVSDEELLPYVVENINNVLKRSYSLVEFDALQGPQLLQVISDVLATLSQTAYVNFAEVQQEKGASELCEFVLKTLGYKPPAMFAATFPQSFTQAETTVIYPMLYWLLHNMPNHHKRVYLARFLSRIEVPDDIRMGDDGVRDLYSHYESLRSDFIQTHKRVDALREAHADPAEARRKIASLEEERERLNTYIGAAQKKLSNVPNKEALLSACKALRVEQEEANKLAERRVEQQQALISSQRRNTEITNRLQNIRRDMQDPRVDSMVRRLKDEVKTNKMKLSEQLPKELNEKRSENAALQKLVSEPLDFQALHSEMGSLDNEVRNLQMKVSERQRPGEDGSSVVSVKQQVQRVVKRKSDILEELNTLQQENERLLAEIRSKEMNISQFRDSNMLRGDDFRRYSNQVRSKTAATKTMKTRLADLRAEWGVLGYTEKLLQDQFETVRADIEEIESRMGIRGYSQTAEKLARVGDEKNNVEAVKGKTLEELSRVVQDFTVTIRERRAKLAPQINELRTVRQQANEVEQEWEDKRSQYEYQEGLLMQDISKIEAEVRMLSDETKMNEALYHRLQSQLVLVNAQLQRATDEREYRSGAKKLDPQYKTYTEMFTRTTEDLERRTKDLQHKRREVEETHSLNVQQVEWFGALKKILEGKLASVKAQAAGGLHMAVAGVGVGKASGAAVNSVDADIQAFLAGQAGRNNNNGVDMLVLGNM